ncbi:hypothetical protein DXG03_000818 [Asterophora parasitica]|uniref:Uncharacterized protein n=1 Tax=Asterophora parasitica TaxID=117018 RepID=A0A9P7GB01_9AGAR|nr:hypothetical protein DXG03_000818 [Asterophora parasitica]
MTGPDQFLKIGSYLPSAVLISVAMMFGGLRVWVDAAWTSSYAINGKGGSELKWSKRRRPVLRVLMISITTVLNFSLAALLAVLLGVPLSISSSHGPWPIRLAKYTGYTILGLGWLLFAQEELFKAIWDWEILAAGLVCLSPPDIPIIS